MELDTYAIPFKFNEIDELLLFFALNIWENGFGHIGTDLFSRVSEYTP